MTGRYVLGISAFYHDSAACLLKEGDMLAAAQEERFNRKKGGLLIFAQGSALAPFIYTIF